ncbi:MAG: PAS domain S-box protein, partial [Pseudomonadota bacterium]
MDDNRKTKGQLIQELEDLRRRIAEFEKSETERKLAEDALIQSEERYRTILDNTQEGYYEVDLAGNFTFVNDAECNDLGYTREELIGMNFKQYTTETTAKKEYELFNRVYRTGEQIKGFEGEFIKKNGTKGFNEISISVIRNKEGKPVGFRGLSRDITERKRAEEDLSNSEEKYRVLFEGSRHGILTADIETGRFIDANPSICRMFGYSNTEWLQLNMASLHPKDFLDQAIYEFKSQIRGEKTLTFALPCQRKDGSVFYADISTAFHIIKGRKYVVGIFADVTDRKLAEVALQQAYDGLEQRVTARTEELQQANEELQSE